MKNLMKKQVKKSLSLFLAVLMMLSCWVWVAPQKAEAGAPNSYDVVITTGDNKNACEDTHRIVFTYADGTTTEKNWANAQNEVAGNETFTLTKWPKKIYFQVGSKNVATARVTRITINGVEIFNGGYTLSATGGVLWENKAEWTLEAGGTQTGQSADWTAPKYANSTTTLNPTSHTLARINSGITSTSTISISNIVDQYGVTYTGSVPFSATLHADGDVTLGSNASITTSGNSRTITIKPWFQTLYPGKQSARLYIDWNVNNGAKSGTETINITFPTYKATFHANGGKIGADDSEAKDTIEYTGEKMNIGSVIGKAPAYATKAGFEFKGFYSTLNADATGKTASFNGTKFVDDETIIPAASSGNGDTNWYAAWQALPITATFMTADNQLIGTVEGRYNNYLTATNMYDGDAGLNLAVKQAYDAITDKKTSISFNTTDNSPIYTDGSTTYKFAGWKIIKAYNDSVVDGNEDTVLQGDVTFQAVYTKADAKTYTVSFEDGNGNILSTKSDYKYRDAVTGIPADSQLTLAQDDRYDYEFIGWAKDIGKNFYTVDEYDNDENGARIVYTHKDGAEFIVKGDASYVPVFRMVPREYKVTYNYTGDNNTSESTAIEGYHWHDVVKMPEIKDNYTAGGYRYYLKGWKINNEGALKQLDEIAVNGDMTLTAVYGDAEAAKYTINFYGKDTDGETDVLLNGDNNIYEHGSTVTAPEVPQRIDTEDSLYTFAGWSPEVNTTASGDADYYATYTKKDYADIHFYNYDGTLIYETAGKDNSLFVGETIPAYTGETPVKEEDVIGTYNFTGWANSAGDAVVPGTDKFAGDTYLYAQFETVYKEYTVKFVNEDETVSETTYHYGDEIVVPEDPTKAADVEYIYDFRAWSPDVSEVCYGDATYEATYRRTPQYYKVTWLNDKKAVHTEGNYTYNAKIQQAVINNPVGYNAPAQGKEWAFKHWVQCDENGDDILVDGQQVIFSRGQRMPAAHLYFYPVFEEVDSVLTVTFYKEDGTTLLGEAKIPFGGNIADYADEFAEKAPKASDDTYHYIINEWVNKDTDVVVTTITADVSVKATYTAEEHNKQIYDVIAEPTCNVPGYAHYKCDVPECTDIDYNVAIAPIADEGAPTGQIYVGANKWTLENYEAGIDYTDIKYVGPNTHLVVNAEDAGSVSEPWNKDGKLSRGVGKIEYYVANKNLGDTSSITNWTEIYNYEELRQEALNAVLKENNITLVDYNGYIRGTVEQQMKKAEIDREVDALLSIYNANATGVVSNLNLENGKTYVIYIKVSDREGNGEVNTCIFSSGTISYGSTAPEIAVSGDGYGTKFCADATVKVTDDTDGFKAYLDGEEVTLTDGKFTCDTKGVHTVTVIDKHGNKTTKTFEIKGNHTYRNYTTAANCVNAGSRYDLCTVCGHKDNEVTLPALGHSYTVNFIDKAPDCINDGYRTYVCDNNCGTKIVLKPTDDATTLAQAKKYVEPAEGEEEGTWEAITADDLKHLKATGAHTYAKVKDAEGEDTEEDAWVIDKAATCKEVGSKHRDCIVCGTAAARQTVEIPVDTENGHKFYREKVTLEPTCTEKGEKTKTCRYCGVVVKTAEIDALGHVAGEYKVITDATCDSTGSKILTCKVCGDNIGEPVKDANGKVTGFDGKAVEIPALGHAYKAEGQVYEKDGKYYQKYVCKNDSTHTEEREVEGYEPPVAATVTFDFNGGVVVVPAVGEAGEEGYVAEQKLTNKVINGNVGDTISASEVTEEPVKAETATYKYTFSHWATKNADGTYTEVKFPIEVKGDATYYAVYDERFVNYTITYYEENGTTEFKKTGYLHNGQVVTLADGPTKAETNLVKYVFAGWKLTTGDTVYTDKVTIDGANINLKATYREVKKQYAVTYAYSKNNILETFAVEAGAAARGCAITPVKKFDSKYHYEFKAWNKAVQLAKVESNIYTTPDFESALHTYDHEGGKVLKAAATCTTAAVYTYTCTCGYTYEKAEGSALEHNWSDPVYDAETGKNTVTCQNDGCGTTEEDTRSFKAEFFVNADDTQAIKTVSYIKWGTTIDKTKLPADPTKDSTATTDYTFKGWVIKGTDEIVDFTKLEIKKDYEFVAVFEGTTREYNVIFAYDAGNIIKTYTGVKAGNSVKLDGIVTPEKAYDATYHYTFSHWQGYEGKGLNITVENVQSDLYILAEFSKAKHEYDNETQLNEATCINGKGTRYSCDCGKYYDVTGKPLDHKFETYVLDETTGKLISYCENKCGTKDVKDPEDDDDNTGGNDTPSTSQKYKLTIRVLENGNANAPVANAQVDIYRNGERIRTDKTGPNGTVAFEVEAGTYGVDVSGIPYQGFYRADVKVSGNTSFDANVYVKRCNCACHDTGLWGTIFRFFHKIIKMITGEFKCCKDPSYLY